MRELSNKLKLNNLLNKLNLPYSREQESLDINYVGSLNENRKNILSFSKEKVTSNVFKGILFAPQGSIKSPSIVTVNNPRLSFVNSLNYIIGEIGLKNIFKRSVADDINMGSNVFLGKGVVIGKNVIIGNNVVINDFAKIGDNCIIKSGTIIGDIGFGFERNSFFEPVRVPHIGNVIIEDSVEIGSMVTVNRGTLGSTLIRKNVKIDDHVHVAHNVEINSNSLICAGAVLGGSCYIGEKCWVGLNSTIHQKVKIRNNVTIGMGANVFKSVNEGIVIAGLPAKIVPKIY